MDGKEEDDTYLLKEARPWFGWRGIILYESGVRLIRSLATRLGVVVI